ncbi:MAG: hypothetical protein WCQ64_07985, partial [Acidobacteriota bacterium]
RVRQWIAHLDERRAHATKRLIFLAQPKFLQQAQGIDQMATALSQMEKVTQTMAATAEESAAASEQLSATAQSALQSVGRHSSSSGASAEPVSHAPSRLRRAA